MGQLKETKQGNLAEFWYCMANDNTNDMIQNILNGCQNQNDSKGFCKEFFFQKPEITMEVCRWVQVSLNFFWENRPKIALNQY